MSSLRKAAGYLESLHLALKSERYNEVPELSRKVRKHDSTRTCLARSAEVQALLLSRLIASQKPLDIANLNHLEGKFQWLSIDAQQLSSERAILQEAYASHATASVEDKSYYDLTNFLFGIVTRQLEAATNLMSQISVHPHNPHLSQSVALRGILEELLERPQDALREYASFPYPDLGASSIEDTLWFEHIKYRLALLDPNSKNYDIFTNWYRQQQGNKRGNEKFLHVLSTRPGSEVYAKELLDSAQFPNADSTNNKLLLIISDIMDQWINDGSDPLIAEKHLDLLREAGTKTFHSPRILRYIVHVLAVLQRYDEVFLALDAYLQLSVHAAKTQPGTDFDTSLQIIMTVHYVVVHVSKHIPLTEYRLLEGVAELYPRISKISSELNINDKTCTNLMHEIHGIIRILHYRDHHDHDALEESLIALSKASADSASVEAHVAAAISQIQQNNPSSALSSVHQALRMDDNNSSALLVFANILCAEEKFDRALLVLGRILSRVNATREKFEENVPILMAKLMQLKIVENTEGPGIALLECPELLTTFRKLFDSAIADSTVLENGSIPAIAVDANNSSPVRSGPPSIRIEPPSETMHAEISSNLLPGSAKDRSNGHSSQSRLPNGTVDKMRSVSGPARSSSLRSSRSHGRLGQHLHLRKSSSVRSMRDLHSVENSSRSSSPLNHPPSSLLSILPDTTSYIDEVDLDRQHTALEIQEKKRKELLAEVWLYIAHLCQSSEASKHETEQAIEEARLLIGQTAVILSMQLNLQWSLASKQVPLQMEIMAAIEEGFDYALSMDDTNEYTILAFAEFLLQPRLNVLQEQDYEQEKQIGRIARAYEMLESLKLSKSACNAKLWQLSAQVAEMQGDVQRAEEEYWYAVRMSDIAGIMDWFRLW